MTLYVTEYDMTMDQDDVFNVSFGGGGGVSSLADLTDTNISSPSNGQVLSYDGTDSKWKNANGIEIDNTLSVTGKAADAKATGDALTSQSEKIDELKNAYDHHGANTLLTILLDSSLWSSNAQTVTATGVLADESKQMIEPIPASASLDSYVSCGVWCDSQASNSLTFKCLSVPSSNLTVYVVVTEVAE